MTNNTNKAIGIITLAAALGAIGCLVTMMMAVDFDAAVVENPLLALHRHVSIPLLKASMLLDLFAYYLLLLPLVFLLRQWAGDHLAARVGSFCGTAYVVVGAIGAAVLATAWPAVLLAHQVAAPTAKEALAADFTLLYQIVNDGLWNLLEMLFAAAWWGWAGWAFWQKGRRKTSCFSALLALACAGDAVSVMAGTPALQQLSLNAYLLLSIGWTAVLGMQIMRGAFGTVAATTKAAAKSMEPALV